MILLTGGTGFLGAHLLAHLLERGDEVIVLARSKQAPCRVCVHRLLTGASDDAKEEYPFVEAGSRARAELEPDGRRRSTEVEEIVHCASSLCQRKRLKSRPPTWIGRVDLPSAGCRRFHRISTSLRRPHLLLPEELAHPSASSTSMKRPNGAGGRRERCARAGIRLSIYRPSIVYGHSETGRSLLFNALYYPVRSALFLKNLYERDIHERGGRRAAEMGVRIDADGWTVMPIRIVAEEGGGINVVPVDFFVRAFGAIREAGDGGIYHLVNSDPTKIEDVIEYGQALFRIRGVSACAAVEMGGKPRTALEAAFETSLEAYGPYMRDRRIFGTERAGAILGRRGIHCPKLTYDILKRCLEYGVQCGWGARLFQG
jgi:nucleoside-diphosphate-sugar epimerase